MRMSATALPDHTQLWDAVRVMTQLLHRRGAHVPSALRGFADRTRRRGTACRRSAA